MNLPLRLKGWRKKVKVSHPQATSSNDEEKNWNALKLMKQ